MKNLKSLTQFMKSHGIIKKLYFLINDKAHPTFRARGKN